MLSYQHSFHAGCYADVIKHFTLCQVLSYMTQKDKPLLYLETHAGRGSYDLTSPDSKKTGEAKDGILKFLAHEQAPPALFKNFMALVGNDPHYYPGSPTIALKLLREIDRIYACELHSREFSILSKIKSRSVKFHAASIDGIEALNAQLPPPEKRALIFIDPSYEIKSEYQSIPRALLKAYQKFPQGVYVLWYPIVDEEYHYQMLKLFKRIDSENTLRVEFFINDERGMSGTGLWIINPPYTLKNDLKIACEHFKKIFNPKGSSYLISP
ncbi:MAG: 23S rRNA (adenine(2030)-N(6))-methyltransferase RlmJ [Gammaproteobacteria bacterium]|nr:23S rRNA (adenine(2030)-N(6))-methyltransferase RlmJ [Gammaproteobacteria bacterium]